MKLLLGVLLYSAFAAIIFLASGGASWPLVYLVTGGAFALSFKVAGEPLSAWPFIRGDRNGVAFSYVISVVGMVLSVYVLLAFSG